jgi:hypothetical protein
MKSEVEVIIKGMLPLLQQFGKMNGDSNTFVALHQQG